MGELALIIGLLVLAGIQWFQTYLMAQSYRTQIDQQSVLLTRMTLQLLARDPKEALLLTDLESRIGASSLVTPSDTREFAKQAEEARRKLAEINKLNIPPIREQASGDAFDMTNIGQDEVEELPTGVEAV